VTKDKVRIQGIPNPKTTKWTTLAQKYTAQAMAVASFEAKVGRLILSHLSINQNFESNLVALEEVYSGPLTIAEDLMCMSVE
jgi:ribonuclease BN (tRNA processing enzyme)